MSLPRIIGVSGHARHGKDSTAEYLECRYGYARYSLAAPLKAACREMFGWTAHELENDKDRVDARWGISPRQALQALGTEYAQAALPGLFPAFAERTGRKLWVRRLLERAFARDEPLIAISDVRFPHEAEEIRAAGGIILRVFRDSVPVNSCHESERAVDEICPDWAIANNGTLDDLHREIDRVMHRIMEAA